MVNINAVSQYAGRLFKAMTLLGISATLMMTTELVNAQSVGISDGAIPTPNANSLLDIRFQGLATAPGKGLLIPRISYQQRTTAPFLNGLNDVASNATERGMLVYQYNDNALPFSPKGFYHWNGTAWVRILDASSGGVWLTGGNAASGTDFLGTTNGEPLRINTNGILRYSISASTGSLLAHQNGSAAAPVFTWNGDDNMGIYRITDDVLGFSTAGTQRLRIAADGNVGIGVLAADPVLEKLQVTGNAVFTTGANRVLSVQDGPTASAPGYNLEIRAGSAFPDLVQGAAGGDLILTAGSANAALAQHQGDVRIISGGNTHSSGGGADGNIILLSGPVAPSVTPLERMRIFNSGVVRINSLGGSGDRLVQTNNAGEISIGPALSSFGTVTSVSVANANGLNGSVATPNSTPVITLSTTATGMLKGSGGAISGVTGATGAVTYWSDANTVAASAVGATGSVLVSGGTGAPTWSTTAALMQDLTIQNGLSLDVGTTYDGSVARTIKLGGPLTEATTISQGLNSFSMGGNTISLNATAGTAVTNIGTGTTTGAVNIGGTGTQAISVGNGAGVKTVNIGSSNTTSATTILSGSGAVSINVSNNQPTNINTGTSTGTVSIGSNTGAQAINVRSGATGAVNINASTGGNNPVNIASGTTNGDVVIGNAAGYVGIGGAVNTTYKMTVTGKVKSTGINETSDERLKKNFESIEGALNKVLGMTGKYYDWRISEFPNLGLSDGRQIGVIAQEMEKILPEVVTTGEDGFKAVEYSHIVPVLIEAIKEQQAIIAGQQQEITSLQSMKDELNTLKASIELLNEHLKTSQK